MHTGLLFSRHGVSCLYTAFQNQTRLYLGSDHLLVHEVHLQDDVLFVLQGVDPSAAPPNRFRLAAVKSGWRAGSSRRAVENSAGGAARVGAT